MRFFSRSGSTNDAAVLERDAADPNVLEGEDWPRGQMQAASWAGWPSDWATPWMHDLGGDEYLRKVSTVMTCVDLNSRTLATMPIYGLYQGNPEKLPDWAENPEPLVYADWIEFAKVLINSILLCGEAVIWATHVDAYGYPARFVVLDVSQLRIEPNGRGGVHIYMGGELLDPREYCHIKYQSLSGRARGISPLEWVGKNLIGADALERYAAEIAQHGVHSVITTPGPQTPRQVDDIKEGWMTNRKANPAAPAVLFGGYKFDVLTLSPKDMALLDLRVFDETRIAQALGVPAFLAGLPQTDGMTYSNANGLFDFHWRSTLRPLAATIYQALSQWLRPPGHSIEANRDEYVRPGLADRAEAYAKLHGIVDEETGERAITISEIRSAERFSTNHHGAL